MSHSKLSRRLIIKSATTACLAWQIPSIASPITDKTLRFYNLHTGEKTQNTFWSNGQFVESELKEINHLLRDFRTNESTAIDRTLLQRLHSIQQLLDNDQAYQVISGYRSPKTNAKLAAQGRQVAKRSHHMQGQAIDVRLEGVALKDLHQAALSLNAGGVGHYPKSDFVHIDTGRTRRWG